MRDFQRYMNRIYKAKQKAENGFIGDIGRSLPFFRDLVFEWMDDTLATKGGLFELGPDVITALNEFSAEMTGRFSKVKPYQSSVSQLLKDLKPISEEIIEAQKELNGIDPKKLKVSDSQQMVVDQIIDAYTENGLNAKFTQPLRDLLYQNISTGSRVQDAKAAIGKYIMGNKDQNGKFARYLEQTAQQAVDSYSGITNKKILETFDYDHVLMSGSLIESSSKQCVYAIEELHGVISREDFEKKLVPIADGNGLIAGTTFDNLPFNKLHWGCRHEFVPIILKEGDKIGNNLVFENGKVKKV